MNEVFEILHRLLHRCDKRLVHHIVHHYWLPAERREAILLRQSARLAFFCDELVDDTTSIHWWHMVTKIRLYREIDDGRDFGTYFPPSSWRSAITGEYPDASFVRLREFHNFRIRLCLLQ